MAIRFAGYGGLFSAVGSRFFDVLFGVEALRGGLLSARSGHSTGIFTCNPVQLLLSISVAAENQTD